MNRTRFFYLTAALVVMIAGLASRKYQEHLPTFVSAHAGDTLWAWMLFLSVSTLMAGRPIFERVWISMVIAFSIEISQFYHALWIDRIRQNTLGGLVLGHGFLWTDLVCYSVGVTIGSILEHIIVVRTQYNKEA